MLGNLSTLYLNHFESPCLVIHVINKLKAWSSNMVQLKTGFPIFNYIQGYDRTRISYSRWLEEKRSWQEHITWNLKVIRYALQRKIQIFLFAKKYFIQENCNRIKFLKWLKRIGKVFVVWYVYIQFLNIITSRFSSFNWF